MIDFIHQTPIEYSKQSRDYQVFCRLYDAIFNLSRLYTDNMSVWGENIDNKLATLRAKTLNFNPVHAWDLDVLESAVDCFKYIMFRKGTIDAIKYVVQVLMRAYRIPKGIGEGYKVEVIDENGSSDLDSYSLDGYRHGSLIKIYVPEQLATLGVVQDLMDYIIPAGSIYRIIIYASEQSEIISKFVQQDSAVARQINVNEMGIYDPEWDKESSEGPHYGHEGYYILHNAVEDPNSAWTSESDSSSSFYPGDDKFPQNEV